MRRPLLLLLLAGLLVLAAWWLASGTRSESAPADGTQDRGSGSAPTEPLAAGTPADTAGSSLERATAPDSADVPFDPATADPADVMRVRVVHAKDGSPVPLAEVLYLDHEGADRERLWAARKIDTDPERLLEELGRSARADADGVAILPRPAGTILLAARFEHSFGSTVSLAPLQPEEAVEIRITPVVHVPVRVEDETGAPLAGVRVGYLCGEGFEAWICAETSTDERGDAELRHLETELTEASRGRRNRIVAVLPGPEPPGVDFSLDAPPRTTVRIVVPRGGSVRVEVFDLEGKPTRDGTPVTLQPALTPAQQEEWSRLANGRAPLSQHHGLGAQISYARDGAARFPHVPLGLRLECIASPDQTVFQTSIQADGPQRPGEEVLIQLRQTQAHPRLSGRVVDAAGTPLSRVTLTGTYWTNWPHRKDSRLSMEYLELDAESRFTKLLEQAVVPPGTARILALQRTLDEDSRLQMAWIFVPERVAESGHDAGDVLFGGPIALAGRVERADGSPVAGAKLDLFMQLAPPEESPTAGAGQVTTTRWLSNADGRFALEGVIPGALHQLQVLVPSGGRSIYQPFALGTTDLRIVIEESGSIQGRVLLDPGIPGDLLYVDYGPATFAEDERPWGSQTWVDRDSGAFEIRGLKPRTWNLSLGLTTQSDPLMLIEGVIVPPAGGPVADPRLEIDLRGKLHLHRVVVIDADGGRPRRINLFVQRDGQWEAANAPNPKDFLDPEPSLRAIVGAEGWGRAEVELTGGEVQVRLPRGLPIRLELEGDGLALSEAGFKIVLRGSRDREGPGFYFTHALKGSWSWSTAVPAAGSYFAGVYPAHANDNEYSYYGNDPPVLIGDQAEVELPVAAGGAEQVFRIRIDAAAVNAAQQKAKENGPQ